MVGDFAAGRAETASSARLVHLVPNASHERVDRFIVDLDRCGIDEFSRPQIEPGELDLALAHELETGQGHSDVRGDHFPVTDQDPDRAGHA